MTTWKPLTARDNPSPYADNQIPAPEWTAREVDAIQRHRLDLYAARQKANGARIKREPALQGGLYKVANQS